MSDRDNKAVALRGEGVRMGGRFVPYKSTALLALAAAVGAGVPFRDEAGHEYLPCGPGPKVPPGRSHRNGTFTRTGAVPRSLHRWLRRADAHAPVGTLSRRAARWAKFHKQTPVSGGAR